MTNQLKRSASIKVEQAGKEKETEETEEGGKESNIIIREEQEVRQERECLCGKKREKEGVHVDQKLEETLKQVLKEMGEVKKGQKVTAEKTDKWAER